MSNVTAQQLEWEREGAGEEPMTQMVVADVAPVTLRSLVERLSPESRIAILAEDPLYIAMSRGDVLWGDLCLREAPWDEVPSVYESVYAPVLVTEDVFWAQPWAVRLEMNGGEHYDTTALSDAEWSDCMTWLYANGWYVWAEGRQGFAAVPDTLPPRVWIPPRAAMDESSSCCGGHSKKEKPVVPLSAPGSDTGRRRAAPRPIFCGGGERCKEGCPYVHGDTIPVLDVLCQFGDACSKRTVGVGATPCCRLHPDEGPWNASMVRHRPTV